MIKNLSRKITNRVLSWGFADEQQREVYEYNLQNRISALIALIVIILTSVLIRQSLWGIIFYLFFTSMSGSTGGYHASTLTKCIMLSDAAFLLSALITRMMLMIASWPMFLLAAFCGLLFAGAMVFMYAPVDHPNLGLTTVETAHLKVKARRRFLVEVSVIAAMVFMWFPKPLICIAVSTLVTLGLSILFSKIKKQEE